MENRRALHYVLKVARLIDSLKFFRDRLGMTVLRHEVFDSGCEASCNGPYDNKWSKTMIGYGPEDDYFVLELTYNYTIGKYQLGNDLKYLRIGANRETFDKIKANSSKEEISKDVTCESKSTDTNLSTTQELEIIKNDSAPIKPEDSFSSTGEEIELFSPDGYKFIIELQRGEKGGAKRMKNDVVEVCLASSDLQKTKKYWTELLGTRLCRESQTDFVCCYSRTCEPRIRFVQLEAPNDNLDRGTAYGRVAFSCPSEQLKPLEELIKKNNETILRPYISLDTPGKASVQVVILADPDGHEICFVGDEGFRQLSKIDPDANKAIEKSITDDKSEEWYSKIKTTKFEAKK